MHIRTRRGLDVRIPGPPRQEIDEAPEVGSVAVLGADHRLHRPIVRVGVGERVRLGQPLVLDRRNPAAVVTAPAAGVVTRVELGERRSLRAVELAVEGREELLLERVDAARLATLRRDEIVRRLVDGGLWPALRERPFHRIPMPETVPRSLFVTATDSNPLAARPDVVLAERPEDLAVGLAALRRLTEGPVFLITEAGRRFAGGDVPGVTRVEIAGPHPAGLVGTHVHLLDPVDGERLVWHVGYQDVLAIGRQLATGRHDTTRVVALGGPAVREPRLLRTRLGACIDDLVRGELREGPTRIISGSVLSGRQASGWGRHLGRHHLQVCAVPEPADDAPRRRWSTSRHGRAGPFLPWEDFERVLPLDLLPTPLLRALVLADDDLARDLGCLELAEEDLALCTYVCPSKIDYGPLLTATLERLEARA